VKAFYCDHFALPLPTGHRFPIGKYARLRRQLIEQSVLRSADMSVPEPVSDAQLRHVHTSEYITAIVRGDLTDQQQRRIGFPWSRELVERSRRSVGGTLAACRQALRDGIAANLAGGTHHAFSDHGEGYCVFNDAAVAARLLQQERVVRRVVIVDCDVHQGNGTAAIFRGDASVVTFSIHGANNYPFRKERSDVDIALPDGAHDNAYLAALREGLSEVMNGVPYDLAIYVAGADPFVGDTLGRLSVSKAGLMERDVVVLSRLRHAGIPVAIVMGGGYAANIDDTVQIHAATVRAANAYGATDVTERGMWRPWPSPRPPVVGTGSGGARQIGT